MSEHLPTVKQIDHAQVPLNSAYSTAIGISYYVLGRLEDGAALDVLRRAVVRNLREAADRLGFDLVPRTSPVSLVIDNTNHAEGPR